MILGEVAIAETAIGEGLDDLSVVRPYQALLQSPTRSFVIAVVIETFDSLTGSKFWYMASTGFQTQADDEYPEVSFEPRMESTFVVSERASVSREGFLLGLSTTSFGTASFRNDDGGIDSMVDDAVDGRSVRVYVGDLADPIDFKKFGLVMKLKSEAWEFSGRSVILRTLDPLAELDKVFQQEKYAGTGGAEGPTSLTGKTKPVTLGRCFHVPAVLIDPSYLIFQVDSGTIEAIDNVYDSGVRLNENDDGDRLDILDIPGGYLALKNYELDERPVVSSREAGMFRLSSPPAGVVTADVRGRILPYELITSRLWDGHRYWDGWRSWAVPSYTGSFVGYNETHAGLLATVLTLGPSWSSEQIDFSDLRLLQKEQAGPCGIHVPFGSSVTTRQLVNQICRSGGIVAWVGRLGQLRFRRFLSIPASSPRFLGERDIVSIERLSAYSPVPPRKIVVRYGKIWTSFNEAQLAGVVRNTAEGLRLTSGFEEVSQDSPDVVSHPMAQDVVVESLFVDRLDAQELAGSLANFYFSATIRLRVVIKQLFAFAIGDSVEIAVNRWGLSQGKVFLVTRVDTDIVRRQTVLEVVG